MLQGMEKIYIFLKSASKIWETATLRAVMSMTCHFILGRWRRCLRIMLAITSLEKSMFVICWQPLSYLQMWPRGFNYYLQT